MNHRILGRTGLSVSEIGLGTLAIGGPFTLAGLPIGSGQVDDKNSLKMISVALDAGVSLIDTADIYGYGHAESLLGDALQGKRQQVVISTKVGNRGNDKEWFKDFSPAWIEKACEGSLSRLKTDYLDLYLLHTPIPPFEFTPALFDVFQKLQQSGKIRFFGCSASTHHQAADAIDAGFGQVVEAVYHLCDRTAEESLFPLAKAKGVGIIVKAPLCSGLLTGKYNKNSFFADDDFRKELYPRERFSKIVDTVDALQPLAARQNLTQAQFALKFCLHPSEVAAVIPGAKTPGQLLDNVRAGEGHLLPPSVMDKISREMVAQ